MFISFISYPGITMPLSKHVWCGGLGRSHRGDIEGGETGGVQGSKKGKVPLSNLGNPAS